MSIFKRLGGWWRSLFAKKDIEAAIGLKVLTSHDMLQAQELWRAAYRGEAPWNIERDERENVKYPSRHLAATVCSELAMVTTVEVNPMISGNKATTEYIEAQFKPFFTNFKLTAEKANYNGTLAIDPAPSGADIDINIVETNEFRVIRTNKKREIVGIVFIYGINRDEKFYTLFKHCEFYEEKQEYTIEHRAFVSNSQEEVGVEINLSDVPEWADLPPTITFYQVEQPWFCVFTVPLNNHIDQNAAEGVAIFSRAMQDIRDLDEHKAMTRWEYKSGERAIDASGDLFKKDAKGNFVMPQGMERLFRAHHDKTLNGDNNFMDVFSPEFRDEAFARGDDRMKRDLELTLSFSYGIISNPQNVAKTATEITSSQERYWQTVSSHQNAWDRLLRERLLPAMLDIAWRYSLCPQGDVELIIDWDDSVIVNQAEQQAEVKAEIGTLVNLQGAGVIDPAQTLAVATKNLKYLSMLSDEEIEEARRQLPGTFGEEGDDMNATG